MGLHWLVVDDLLLWRDGLRWWHRRRRQCILGRWRRVDHLGHLWNRSCLALSIRVPSFKLLDHHGLHRLHRLWLTSWKLEVLHHLSSRHLELLLHLNWLHHPLVVLVHLSTGHVWVELRLGLLALPQLSELNASYLLLELDVLARTRCLFNLQGCFIFVA